MFEKSGCAERDPERAPGATGWRRGRQWTGSPGGGFQSCQTEFSRHLSCLLSLPVLQRGVLALLSSQVMLWVASPRSGPHSHRPFRTFWALCYTRAGGVGRGGMVRVSVHHPSAHQLHLPHSLARGCGQASGNHRAWQPIGFLVIIQDGAALGPCPQHHWVVSLWKFASVSFSHCWPQPAPKARPSNTSVT